MKVNRCISCENEIEQYPCPHCGFDGGSYRQPEHSLPCNCVLHGRYLVGRVLGQGGFGITYVGWDLVLQYKCAIKEFYPKGQAMRKNTLGLDLCWGSDAQTESFRRTGMESFLKEARKMNKVEHIPEVVRVRDTFIEHQTAYIVMDYVEGRTLKERLDQEGVLSWREAQAIFLPVIAAMEKVHQTGLIHRDLSPDNLMLLSEGSVRILDLGAAKDLSINSGASSMQVAKGGFSPLEQYTQRGGSGPWSDVYALAATMYYSLTGVLPPTAVDRIEADTIAWDLPQLKALPRVVLTALQKAMAVTAAKRTQSMAELLKQLKAAPKPKPVKVKQEKPSKVKKEKPPKPEKIKKEKLPREPKPERKPISPKYRILAAVLALVILGGLIYNALPAPVEKQLAVPEETMLITEEQTVPTESTEPPHVHNWAPATVGSPARCRDCGIMTGTSLDCTLHAWGESYVFGVREDGTLAVAQPKNSCIAFEVQDWNDVASVHNLCAVKNDGTVLFESFLSPEWTGIAKAVSPGFLSGFVAGLRQDGTVAIATRGTDWSSEAFLNVDSWTDIVDVAAGYIDPQDYVPNAGMPADEICYTVGLKSDGTLRLAMDGNGFADAQNWRNIVSVVADGDTLLGLQADGTVKFTTHPTTRNDWAQLKERLAVIEDWTDIVQIASSDGLVVGLKANGTVVTNEPQADISHWTDIVLVASSGEAVFGLKSDGSVKELNFDRPWNTQVTHWRNIRIPQPKPVPEGPAAPVKTLPQDSSAMNFTPEQRARHKTIALGYDFAVGIRNNGTVTASGSNENGQCDVDGWQNIVSVAAGGSLDNWGTPVKQHTLGLKADGTVVAAGSNDFGQCNVGDWNNIVEIIAAWNYSIGLKADGTVVAVGGNSGGQLKVSEWTDIKKVCTTGSYAGTPDYFLQGTICTIGLRTDGTVVTAGNDNGLTEAVAAWTDIRDIFPGEIGEIFGIKTDGTVVAAGNTFTTKRGGGYDQGDMKPAKLGSFGDIVSIGGHCQQVVGLRGDGTAVKAESPMYRTYDPIDISGLKDVVWMDCSDRVWDDLVAVGLKSDGTVTSTYWPWRSPGWTDIVALSLNGSLLGLRSDGTAVSLAGKYQEAVDVSSWSDIRLPYTG